MRVPLLLSMLVTVCAACATTDATHANAPSAIDVPVLAHPEGESAAWWYRAGAARAAANGAMRGRAKNVILFLGDGMSLPTVAAARILEGQRRHASGEENALAFERFPYTALSKTYNTDFQTPDSAGTMTAIATGAKTRLGVIGVGQGALRGDCASARGNALLSIVELAESAGLATGIVTTTRITHATPASVYAHVPDRNWEDDAHLPAAARAAGCSDIASQLVGTPFGDGPEVVFGGGRARFQPTSVRDPEYGDQAGLRLDGRDLVVEWQQQHPEGRYVWNAQQLAAAAGAPRVLGLFEPSHLLYDADRLRAGNANEPSLADLTRAALGTLQRGGKGFVLVVEGGRIDLAHHAGNARRALEETIAFSDAIRAADELAGDDTLVLVTADHAHTMHFAGYPQRGNPILGKVRGFSGEDAGSSAWAVDRNGLPYTTLGYANGPGSMDPSTTRGGRPDLTNVDTEALDYLQEAHVPMSAETHGGEDVGIWARGPGAEAVRGTVEENVIYHLLVQATPALRARLCAAGTCNTDGVPVELPKPDDFKRAH